MKYNEFMYNQTIDYRNVNNRNESSQQHTNNFWKKVHTIVYINKISYLIFYLLNNTFTLLH